MSSEDDRNSGSCNTGLRGCLDVDVDVEDHTLMVVQGYRVLGF